MKQNESKRVCIIVDCLSIGGAEKIAGVLSIELEKLGYDISIISLWDKITYPYTGTLYNLGENESKIKWVKQIKKFFKFKKAYKNANADFYIDFRVRNRTILEFLLHAFVFVNSKMIFTIHNYHVDLHIPNGNYFRKFYKKSHKVVAVSKAIEDRLNGEYGLTNTKLIYNFIDEELVSAKAHMPIEINLPSNYIVSVSRLNNAVKQIDSLIDTYKNSELPKSDVKLLILGEGEDKVHLEAVIEKENLEENVFLLGFKDNPYPIIKNAQFLVLCSKFEGFPMVLLESLKLGTPVVSFNCTSGPNEIIRHNQNGLLVEDQNFEKYKEALNTLTSNEALYSSCKNNAQSSVEKFNTVSIMREWKEILK
ncbi:MAG: hypothetical protein CMC14_11765 [Flavobacteriaceae bacterium]|nr:hypothetical protein [Flavobacteriaceae bacterium]|tara:strand:- start:60592 stop:61686 length:1095 start_codon:yes stop_codon:yes gene_type:complete